jgi:hypothetical protein
MQRCVEVSKQSVRNFRRIAILMKQTLDFYLYRLLNFFDEVTFRS